MRLLSRVVRAYSEAKDGGLSSDCGFRSPGTLPLRSALPLATGHPHGAFYNSGDIAHLLRPVLLSTASRALGGLQKVFLLLPQGPLLIGRSALYLLAVGLGSWGSKSEQACLYISEPHRGLIEVNFEGEGLAWGLAKAVVCLRVPTESKSKGRSIERTQTSPTQLRKISVRRARRASQPW